jgi:hypothetical protein
VRSRGESCAKAARPSVIAIAEARVPRETLRVKVLLFK